MNYNNQLFSFPIVFSYPESYQLKKPLKNSPFLHLCSTLTSKSFMIHHLYLFPWQPFKSGVLKQKKIENPDEALFGFLLTCKDQLRLTCTPKVNTLIRLSWTKETVDVVVSAF